MVRLAKRAMWWLRRSFSLLPLAFQTHKFDTQSHRAEPSRPELEASGIPSQAIDLARFDTMIKRLSLSQASSGDGWKLVHY